MGPGSRDGAALLKCVALKRQHLAAASPSVQDVQFLQQHDEESNVVWQTWRARKDIEAQLRKEEIEQ